MANEPKPPTDGLDLDQLESDLNKSDSTGVSVSNGITSKDKPVYVDKGKSIVSDQLKTGSEASDRKVKTTVSRAFKQITETSPPEISAISEAARQKKEALNGISSAVSQDKLENKLWIPKVSATLPKEIYFTSPQLVSHIGKKSSLSASINKVADILEIQRRISVDQYIRNKSDMLINNQIGRGDRLKSFTILSQIESSTQRTNQFFTGTFRKYLMTDIELKYKHIYVSRDILRHTKLLIDVMSAKLDSVKHNTSISDVVKLGVLGEIKRNIRGTFTKFAAEKIFEPFKQPASNIADLVIGSVQGFGAKHLKNFQNKFKERFPNAGDVIKATASQAAKQTGEKIREIVPESVLTSAKNLHSVVGKHFNSVIDRVAKPFNQTSEDEEVVQPPPVPPIPSVPQPPPIPSQSTPTAALQSMSQLIQQKFGVEEKMKRYLPDIVAFVSNISKHIEVTSLQDIITYLQGGSVDDTTKEYLSLTLQIPDELKKNVADLLKTLDLDEEGKTTGQSVTSFLRKRLQSFVPGKTKAPSTEVPKPPIDLQQNTAQRVRETIANVSDAVNVDRVESLRNRIELFRGIVTDVIQNRLTRIGSDRPKIQIAHTEENEQSPKSPSALVAIKDLLQEQFVTLNEADQTKIELLNQIASFSAIANQAHSAEGEEANAKSSSWSAIRAPVRLGRKSIRVAGRAAKWYAKQTVNFYKGLFKLTSRTINALKPVTLVKKMAHGTASLTKSLTSLGASLTKAILGVELKLLKGVAKGGLAALKGGFKFAKFLFVSKNRFVDVYRKDAVESGKPLMKGIDIKAGFYVYADGTPVKDSFSIRGPVFDSRTQQLVVSSDDIQTGLVDFRNDSLSTQALAGFGTRLVKKSIKLGVNAVKKSVKLTAKAIIAPVKIAGKVTGLANLYRGARDSVKGKGPSVDVATIEDMVTKHLKTIIKLLQPINAHYATVRSGSYQDYKQQHQTRSARLKINHDKAKTDATNRMKRFGKSTGILGSIGALLGFGGGGGEEGEGGGEGGSSLIKDLGEDYLINKALNRIGGPRVPGKPGLLRRGASLIGRGARGLAGRTGSLIRAGASGIKGLATSALRSGAVGKAGSLLRAGASGIKVLATSALSGAGQAIKTAATTGLRTVASGAGRFLAGTAVRSLLVGGATLLGEGAAALAGAVASPVVLGGLAIAGLGAAAYGTWKWWKGKKRRETITQMRNVIYKVPEKKLGKLIDFENDLAKLMAAGKGMEKGDIDDYIKAFDLDPENKDHVSFFKYWYGRVFFPIFKASYDLFTEKYKVKFKDQDDLTDEQLTEYKNEIEQNSTYRELQSVDIELSKVGFQKWKSGEIGTKTTEEAKAKEDKDRSQAIKDATNPNDAEKDKNSMIANVDKAKEPSIWDKVKTTAGSMAAGMSSGLSSIKNYASRGWNATTSALSSAYTGASNAISSAYSGAKNAVSSGLSSAADWTSSKYSQAKEAIGEGVSYVKNMVAGGLGSVVSKYESGKAGVSAISGGAGDPGGASYGQYQLSSKAGTLASYLKSSGYDKEFAGMSPGSPEFNSKWKMMAATDPNFGQTQHDFIQKTHFDPAIKAAAQLGFNTDNRAIQEAVWSGSIQHGGIKKILEQTAQIPGFSNLTPKEQLIAFYKMRGDYAATNMRRNGASEQVIQNASYGRYKNELQDVLGLVDQSGAKGEANTTSAPSQPTSAPSSEATGQAVAASPAVQGLQSSGAAPSGPAGAPPSSGPTPEVASTAAPAPGAPSTPPSGPTPVASATPAPGAPLTTPSPATPSLAGSAMGQVIAKNTIPTSPTLATPIKPAEIPTPQPSAGLANVTVTDPESKTQTALLTEQNNLLSKIVSILGSSGTPGSTPGMNDALMQKLDNVVTAFTNSTAALANSANNAGLTQATPPTQVTNGSNAIPPKPPGFGVGIEISRLTS